MVGRGGIYGDLHGDGQPVGGHCAPEMNGMDERQAEINRRMAEPTPPGSPLEIIDREYFQGLLAERDAEIERLLALLKPFDEFAQFVAAGHPGWDHDHFTIFGGLTLAPFRAVRAAIPDQQNGDKT